MNTTTTGAVLADAGPPPPTGGDFSRLMHYGGWAVFFVCLLGFAATAARMAWMVWRRDAPVKGVGLVLVCTLLYGAAGAGLGSVF